MIRNKLSETKKKGLKLCKCLSEIKMHLYYNSLSEFWFDMCVRNKLCKTKNGLKIYECLTEIKMHSHYASLSE